MGYLDARATITHKPGLKPGAILKPIPACGVTLKEKRTMEKPGRFFSAAATFLLKKCIAFKYTGDYIECALFTLTQHVDGRSMWVEDDTERWTGFTDLPEFKKYLNKIKHEEPKRF